jgi:putative phosphoribosyl transferase
MARYRNRAEAGRALARAIERNITVDAAVVLGLANDGVPVATEVAFALGTPLDVILVRKLRHSTEHDVVVGTIASGDVQILDETIVAHEMITAAEINALTARESAELHRREVYFRRGRPPADLAGRTAILVDDGLATSATMRATLVAVRRLGALEVLVAAPVGSSRACTELLAETDRLVCPLQPENFSAISDWYDDVAPVTDEAVRACLDRATERRDFASKPPRADLLAE